MIRVKYTAAGGRGWRRRGGVLGGGLFFGGCGDGAKKKQTGKIGGGWGGL